MTNPVEDLKKILWEQGSDADKPRSNQYYSALRQQMLREAKSSLNADIRDAYKEVARSLLVLTGTLQATSDVTVECGVSNVSVSVDFDSEKNTHNVVVAQNASKEMLQEAANAGASISE